MFWCCLAVCVHAMGYRSAPAAMICRIMTATLLDFIG
jgi:hypothetical protein